MTRVLITGSNSFIGTNFRKISRFPDLEEISLKENSPESIDFSRFDVVLHLAAIVHYSSRIDESTYFRVNRDLCVETAERAKAAGVRQFLFLSTIKVYGKYMPGFGSWNETSACYPDGAYGRSKYEAEQALRKLDSEEFRVSIIRTPIVYGPGVGANIMKLIKLIERFPVLPFRNINNHRHYTYVENLVGYIDRIIETGARGTFLAMDECPMSTTELVERISALLQRKPLLVTLPDFLIRLGIALKPAVFDRLYKSFYIDNSATRKTLDFKSPFTSNEGLSRTISYYLANKHGDLNHDPSMPQLPKC